MKKINIKITYYLELVSYYYIDTKGKIIYKKGGKVT